MNRPLLIWSSTSKRHGFLLNFTEENVKTGAIHILHSGNHFDALLIHESTNVSLTSNLFQAFRTNTGDPAASEAPDAPGHPAANSVDLTSSPSSASAIAAAAVNMNYPVQAACQPLTVPFPSKKPSNPRTLQSLEANLPGLTGPKRNRTDLHYSESLPSQPGPPKKQKTRSPRKTGIRKRPPPEPPPGVIPNAMQPASKRARKLPAHLRSTYVLDNAPPEGPSELSPSTRAAANVLSPSDSLACTLEIAKQPDRQQSPASHPALSRHVKWAERRPRSKRGHRPPL